MKWILLLTISGAAYAGDDATEEVIVPPATRLSLVAEAAQVPVGVLLRLTPELRRTRTPRRPYALRIPRGTSSVFGRNWPLISSRAPGASSPCHVAAAAPSRADAPVAPEDALHARP